MPIQSYEDIDAYQNAMKLLKPVHQALLSFPDYEKFELCSQIRRASKSIPTNIAEGFGRSAKEFKRYLSMAMGSCNEMIVHLKIAKELGYIDAETCDEWIEAYTVIGKQLNKLIQVWRDFSKGPASGK